jgi:DNA-binding protein H-NS
MRAWIGVTPKRRRLSGAEIDKLLKLKAVIDDTLTAKISEQRRALEAELSKLGRFESGKKATRGVRAGSSVAPKYRNPENPSETWAGRGLKPRWLAAAIKSGKKIEYFAIGASAAKGAPAKNGRRKKAKK